jgi:hypothetical protein
VLKSIALVLGLGPLISLNSAFGIADLKSKHAALAVNPIVKEEKVKLMPSSDCFRFKVAMGDCYESKDWSDCTTFRERAELVDFRPAPLNSEVRYRFSFMLPLGYPSLEVKQIIGQWHNSVYGPTLSLRHLNGLVWLDLMLEKNQTTKKFFLPNIQSGIWYTLDLRVVWSKSSDGVILLTVDDHEIVDYRGSTLDSDLSLAPYFRFGLYRSHLYRVSKPEWPTQSIFYCDVSTLF